MKRARFWVSGVGGRLGSVLAKRLLKEGFRVVGLDVREGFLSGYRHNDFEMVLGSFEDRTLVDQTLKGVDCICHLAIALSNEPRTVLGTNWMGTLNILEGARSAGVRHVLYASSIAALGEADPGPMAEDRPARPETFFHPLYGILKHCLEKLHLGYYAQFGLPVTVFRLSEPYTREWIFDEPLARSYPVEIVAKASKGDSIDVPAGVGKDWVHARDVAQAFLAAWSNENVYGEVVHIGGDAYVTWPEFAQQIVEAIDSTSSIREVPREEWRGDAHELNNLRLDISKARSLLSYEPVYPKAAFLKMMQQETRNWVRDAGA
jgi:UDP-glucose 4-epimerase